MRAKWLPWLALLACLTVLLPVAQKSVVELECNSYSCRSGDRHFVTYRLLFMNDRAVRGPDLEVPLATGDGQMRWYGDAIPHEEGRTALLLGGFAALPAAPVAAVMIHRYVRSPSERRLRAAWIAYATFAGAVVATGLGIIWHAATWRGADVSWLTPHIGAFALAASLGCGWPLYATQQAADAPVGLPTLPEPVERDG